LITAVVDSILSLADRESVKLLQRKLKMKVISKETKTYKLLNALKEGQKFTASDAAKKFGIKNIAAEASRLRQNGYAVYANSRTAKNGVTVTEYELGMPSREIVALGYLARRLGLSVE